jgi:transcription antitermination factor NusG
VFVKLTKSGQWHFLKALRGVSDIVMTNDQPSRLNKRDIEYLKSLEAADGLIRLPRKDAPRFKRGDKVHVTRGTTVISAIFDGMSTRGRCKVLMTLLGGTRAVEIDEKALPAVKAA